MKKFTPILAIIAVIAIISVVIILVIRNRAKNQLEGQPNKLLPGFNLPTSSGNSPTQYGSFGSELPAISPEQDAQLKTACAIPTSRAAVERVYGIKCEWYGY